MSEYGHHLVDEVRAGRMTRRQMVARATVFGFSAASISGLLQACGSSSKSGSSSNPATTTGGTQAAGNVRRGGSLRVGAAAPTSDVDPIFTADQGGIFSMQLAGDTLLKRRADTSLEPRL